MKAPPNGDRAGVPRGDHGIPEWVLRGAVLCATVLGALTLLPSASLGLVSRTTTALDDVVEIGLVLLAVAPWWRRSWITSTSPAVTAAVLVPPALLALAGAPPVCMALLALGTARVTVFGGFWRGFAFAAVSAGVVIARATLVESSSWFIWKSYIELGFALGLAMRGSRLLVLKERETAEVLARHAAAEERRRIARDVHDAIAHSLSVIMLQLNGARALVAHDPDEANEALDEAITEGRRSLDEIRRVVGLLGPTCAHETPGPGVAASIWELIASYRRAGLDTRLDLHIPARDQGLAADHSETWSVVYRIVQESLANAVKHAPGSSAQVAIVAAHGELSVRITNALGAPGDASGPGGHGVQGMRERVEQLGGVCSFGPSGRRWVVECHLPLPPLSETDARHVAVPAR